MTKDDLSALLTSLLQRLTQGDGVDIRHDQMLNRKQVLDRLGISRPTLDKALDTGDFPKAVKVAGQERWPSSVINEYIRQTNPHLRERDALRAQAAKALKGAQL